MLRRIVQAIVNFFRRIFGGGDGASSAENHQPPLTDAECEYYFLQLLDGVAQGWERPQVERFFKALSDRASDERWLAWLHRFGQARLSDEPPQVELGRRMVGFSQVSARHSASVAGEIGQKICDRARVPATPPEPTPEPAPQPAATVATPAETRPEDPQEVERWLTRGVEQLDAEQYQAALLAFDRVLAIDANHLRAWIYRGDALADLKNFNQALQAYEKAVAIDPQSAEAWSHLGDLQHELKRPREAIQSWDKALELDPKDIQTWLHKGVALGVQLGRWEEALDTWNHALELDRNDADLWFRRGVALATLERWDAAVESWDTALELNPYFRDAWINKGVALQKLGRYEEAIEANNRALGLDRASDTVSAPSNLKDAVLKPSAADTHDEAQAVEEVETLYRQAQEQAAAENHHAALRFLDRALAIAPEDRQVLELRCRTLEALGQLEETLACCDRLFSLDAEAIEVLRLRARTLQKLQRWEPANTAWDAVLAKQPTDKNAWLNKGVVLQKLGRYGEAIEANKLAI